MSPAACQKAPERSVRPAVSRPAAPEFTLKDLNGQPVTLSSLRGTPVFLDFWATWCGPCRMSMPMVQALHDAYGDKVHVLGLNVDEDPAAVAAFVTRMKITYPVLLAGTSGVDSEYGVSGIPAFLILDKAGRAVEGWTGFAPSYADEWRRTLDKVLAEK
jgi:thiol-disulfide isomerase/thioredoxin